MKFILIPYYHLYTSLLVVGIGTHPYKFHKCFHIDENVLAEKGVVTSFLLIKMVVITGSYQGAFCDCDENVESEIMVIMLFPL